MENFTGYHVPFYVVGSGTSAVATTGHSADMSAGQLGLFNRANFNVSTAGSTEKEVFIAQAPNGGKDWYTKAATGSHKSPFFLVSDVEDIYKSLPQTIQNEEWVIGYNGAASSVGLSFEKGKATRLKLYFHGEATYRYFNGPKEYVISHTPTVNCAEPCDGVDCTETQIQDQILEAKKLVEKIMGNVDLQKFGVKAHLVFEGATDEGTGGLTTATRTLRITLARTAAGADRTTEIQTALAGVEGIVKNTGVVVVTKTAGVGTTTEGIADDYVVSQVSYGVADAEGGLSANAAFTYADVPAIEGVAWVVTGETDSATTAAATPVVGRKLGIRISAGYSDPKFSDASFDVKDYYATQPVKMEVSLLQEDGDKCDAAKWPSVIQTKQARVSRQSGEYVIREVIMKSDAYLKHVNAYSGDPREREAFDQKLLSSVDRNAFYNLYYVRYKASYGNSYRKNEQETFTTVFAVKSTDTDAETALNTNIIDVLETRSGVTMHTNS